MTTRFLLHVCLILMELEIARAYHRLNAVKTQQPVNYHWLRLAGVQGFEPQLPDPESGVLPLDDTPSPGSILYRRRPALSTRSGGATMHPPSTFTGGECTMRSS